MTRPITDIVTEGEALGVVGGVAASLPVGASSEQIDDRVAALLAAGSNVTLTYDDVANTLTIAATGGGASTADTVSIVDAGGYFTGSDVEAALQELGAGGGGGGGTTIRHKFVSVGTDTTATINTSNAWANLSAHLAAYTDLTLTGCSVGDVVVAEFGAEWANEATFGGFDVCTVVSGAVTNYFSTGSSTASASYGPRQWLGRNSVYASVGGSARYALQSGDLSSGAATIRMRVKTSGSKTVTANGTFSITNIGAVQA